MSKQKQDKQGGGWQFPRPIEIIKCKEGNKEYMKERPARKPYGRIVKVCEFNLEAVAEFGGDDARAVWRLAKRTARDFLRVSWINTAIVNLRRRVLCRERRSRHWRGYHDYKMQGSFNQLFQCGGWRSPLV